QPPQRALLHITTPGKFRYEINKDFDLARFDVRPARPTRPSETPMIVQVVRTNLANGAREQIMCHLLTLRLRRKDNQKKGSLPPAAAPKPGDPANKGSGGPMEGVEIETVHAIVFPIKGRTTEVTLTSDSERAKAHGGKEFFHDANNGLSILKGDMVTVDKDD